MRTHAGLRERNMLRRSSPWLNHRPPPRRCFLVVVRCITSCLLIAFPRSPLPEVVPHHIAPSPTVSTIMIWYGLWLPAVRGGVGWWHEVWFGTLFFPPIVFVKIARGVGNIKGFYRHLVVRGKYLKRTIKTENMIVVENTTNPVYYKFDSTHIKCTIPRFLAQE